MKVAWSVVLLFCVTVGLYPCSIFRYSINGRTYFCGNEDWSATNPAIMTCQPKENEYGVVLFGWKNLLPRYIQAGINSEGLCFDWAAVPAQQYLRDPAKEDVSLDFTLAVLKKCVTVDEAIAYVTRHNIPHLAEEHIMFADKSGASCVLEYNHSKLKVIRSNGQSQFITNFHVSDTSLGWYPCDRYARMEAFFKGNGSKETRLVELLDAVHQEGQYPTVYSYVFDLGAMEITVFHDHNYRVKRVFALAELLRKDTVLDLSF